MPFVSDEEWILIQQKLARMDELEKLVAELEAKLVRYENANTPPSLSYTHVGKISGDKKHHKPGREKGHEGIGRKTPEVIHQRKKLKLKCCPHCGGKLKNKGKRKRTATDIKPGQAINTEYEIQRGYCDHCNKIVEPVVADTLPNSRFGLHLALYIAFLSMLGITLSKIKNILEHDYNLGISKATVSNTLEQLASFLGRDYEKLRLQLLEQKKLFADETSHPINGKNAWLWTFVSETIAFLRVEQSRGQKVVKKTLKGFKGILHSDFWSAYNVIDCDKQKCLAHLKRELKYLREKTKSKELKKYCSKLLRLLKYAWEEKKHSTQFREFCENRLLDIISQDYADKNCIRLNKRLQRHAKEIFVFIDANAEITNNAAERSLRPCVIKRKNTYGSHSLDGAQAHAVITSFYQTTQLQKQNFEKYMTELVENQLQNRTQI